VDATFPERDRRSPFVELAQERDVPLVHLVFTAPREVLEERVRRRHTGGHDAAPPSIVPAPAQPRSTDAPMACSFSTKRS
jgi:predicted kinase